MVWNARINVKAFIKMVFPRSYSQSHTTTSVHKYFCAVLMHKI